jgi:pimeloyl-ACP methyl ester carboxylesterase
VSGQSPEVDATAIQSLRISVEDEQLADLDRRLLATRWPDGRDLRSHRVPVFRLRGIVHHWLHHYDWRARERVLNSFGWFSAVIDDAAIDFLHVRSSRPDAVPVLLVHGWPGSVLKFRSVVRGLTEPAGADAELQPAFHVVIPCLPGAPEVTSWDTPRIARAWAELVTTLGYDRWFAHGGGWGARLTVQLGLLQPEGLEAVHLATYGGSNRGAAIPPATDSHAFDIALTDSPAALAAWVSTPTHRGAIVTRVPRRPSTWTRSSTT